MVKTTNLFLPNLKWKAITTAVLHPARVAVKLLPELYMQDSATKSIHRPASQGQVHLCALFQTAPAEGAFLKQLF